MRASQLIDGASFGPEALKVVAQAFEQTWAQIEATYGNDPRDIERGRLRLANALLSVASEDSRNVAVLSRAALEAMALGYRDRHSGHP